MKQAKPLKQPKQNYWNKMNIKGKNETSEMTKKYAKKKKLIIIKWMPRGVRCYILIAIGLALGVEGTFIIK